MSRSYRKTPKIARCGNVSDKEWKRDINRRTRRKVNSILKSTSIEELDNVVLPERRVEYGDVWDSIADGKAMWFGDLKCCRTEYNIYITRRYCEKVTIDEEFFKTAFEEYSNMTPDLFHHYKEQFEKYGELEMRPYMTEALRTLEEEVQENNKLYKKQMRK